MHPRVWWLKICVYTLPQAKCGRCWEKNVLLLFKYGILESIKDPIEVRQHSLEKS